MITFYCLSVQRFVSEIWSNSAVRIYAILPVKIIWMDGIIALEHALDNAHAHRINPYSRTQCEYKMNWSLRDSPFQNLLQIEWLNPSHNHQSLLILLLNPHWLVVDKPSVFTVGRCRGVRRKFRSLFGMTRRQNGLFWKSNCAKVCDCVSYLDYPRQSDDFLPFVCLGMT